MLDLRRTALLLVNAFFITTVLFLFMYSLIHMDDPELSSSRVLPPIKLSNIPEEIPPKPLVIEIVDTGKIDVAITAGYQPPKFKGGNDLPIDNQLVIAIGFPPEYPNRLLERGIEGYAIVGFSVSAAGSVVDPYIVESEPKGVFDRASLKAISKFKYKARKVNGRPVSTDGQRYMFTFKIDE